MIRNRSATLAWKDGFEMGFQKGYATARADIFTTTLRMKRRTRWLRNEGEKTVEQTPPASLRAGKPYKNAPPEIK